MPNFLTTRIPGVIQTATYFKPPQAILINPGAISQPVGTLEYLIPTTRPFIKVPTTVVAPTGVASWLGQSINQPYFTPYDANPYSTSTSNIGTYFKKPLPPTGVASWLANTITQPYISLSPQQPTFPFIKMPTVVVVPTGFASWAARTISQPVLVSVSIQTPAFFLYTPVSSTKHVKLQGYSHGWSYPI